MDFVTRAIFSNNDEITLGVLVYTSFSVFVVGIYHNHCVPTFLTTETAGNLC